MLRADYGALTSLFELFVSFFLSFSFFLVFSKFPNSKDVNSRISWEVNCCSHRVGLGQWGSILHVQLTVALKFKLKFKKSYFGRNNIQQPLLHFGLSPDLSCIGPSFLVMFLFECFIHNRSYCKRLMFLR